MGLESDSASPGTPHTQQSDMRRPSPQAPGIPLAVSATAALSYAAISVASNFVTKMAGRLLPGAPDAVLTAQLFTMLLVMQAARHMGWVDWAPTTATRIYSFLPQSLTYGIHAALVLRALSMLNVPIYNILKRMTPIIVLCAKACMDKKLPSVGITCSVVLTVLGCVVTGLGDLTFEIRSYMVALGAAALQATYILLTENASPSASTTPPPRIISLSQFGVPSPSKDASPGPAPGHPEPKLLPATDIEAFSRVGSLIAWTDLGAPTSPRHAYAAAMTQGAPACIPPALRPGLCVAAESMHYAALTCLPLAAASALLSGQIDLAQAALFGGSTLEAVNGNSQSFWWWLAIIANMEWLLTGSLVVCTQANSALTTTVVGVLKGILAVILGFFLMGGVGPEGMSWTGILGIAMNCAGGVWYAVVKWRESTAAKPARS